VEPIELAAKAFRADDAPEVARLFVKHPELRLKVNDPSGDFGAPAIVRAKSKAMLDVLLAAGADINARSNWWAGGFGLLDQADPSLAMYAIERGARVTAHSAARLGLFDELKAIIAAHPEAVRERGGDGQTPLHFASTTAIADFLLESGADIDARDVDHVSTPAQWMIGERSELARHLVGRGCSSDVLMAAALGDVPLVTRHLDDNPESVRMRVSDEWFPMVGGANGGTIYQWQLGWYVSAAQVARRFNQPRVFEIVMARSPLEEQLLNMCWLGDEAAVTSLLADTPRLADRLPASGRRQAAHAARNNDTNALRLFIAAGLPVDPAEARTQHRASALHWAAWFGNVEAVRLVLSRHPPLDDAENDFKGTPLGWARHGAEHCWSKEKGDYSAVIDLLTTAGAKP
jgi:Ankyrin repeat